MTPISTKQHVCVTELLNLRVLSVNYAVSQLSCCHRDLDIRFCQFLFSILSDSGVMFDIGKPHPRWADPNYYDGDSSDKWHTRSQKRGNFIASSLAKQRRQQSPSQVSPLVKTEPTADIQQNCYYRLSPSPPPSATSAYSMSIGHVPPNHYVQSSYETVCNNPNLGAAACSTSTYSPSSSSSSGPNGW